METTRELYQKAKAAAGVESDYAMAKILEVSKGSASNYANGRTSFDDEVARKVAELLKVEPGYIAACANAERAKTPKTRSMWARVAAVLIALSPIPPAAGSVDNNAGNNANYQKLKRAVRRLTGADLMLSL